MPRSPAELRVDVERIWRAGVAAVMPKRLVQSHIQIDGDFLQVGEETVDLRNVGRIAIVGAGKAAGAMAAALEDVLGPQRLADKSVHGWVNVPADCVVPTRRVQLHPARPAGVNEPRPEGVAGTRQILELVSSLGSADLCFCLLTGGGSALLPAPVPELSLDDKIQVTRLLSAAGANIEQLNIVRRQLSRTKGGGLARACRAGWLFTLLISDVPGDSLEVIASGPTVTSSTTAADALAVLDGLDLFAEPTLQAVVRYLSDRQREATTSLERDNGKSNEDASHAIPIVRHFVLGNNATAVDAAGAEAERLGYSHAMISANAPEGPAEAIGRHLAETALRMRRDTGPDCLISGGEPTVKLVDESRRGRGGRNQQLALAALVAVGDSQGIAILSGGTDGEDGPTDAAGAFVTEGIVRAARRLKLDPQDYLARNDAHEFFKQCDGLFITGPTQSNVCDLRVVAVNRNTR